MRMRKNNCYIRFLVSVLFLVSFKVCLAAPLVIGHRGASGYRPEHTLEAYRLAIEMGADYIEPDLVMTKDKVLVARHENEISETTNVAEVFPDRKTKKSIDGVEKSGWFVEDFTLAEIKKLRAVERLPQRDHQYDKKFLVPTFQEILTLVSEHNQKKGRKHKVGVYPETKHPSFFTSLGLSLEEALVAELKRANMNNKDSLVFIQSFELGNLKKLRLLTPVPLVFLLGSPDEIPYDEVLSGSKNSYASLMKAEGLKELAKTIQGIGPHKAWLQVTPKHNGKEFLAMLHRVGLKVHPYTFRSDKPFLDAKYKTPDEEYLEYFSLGVDGVFSDFTDHAVRARASFLEAGAK